MDIDTLKAGIIKEFTPFWALNDPAHRIEHFENVFQCAVQINDALGFRYDLRMLLLAAYFHDLFTWQRNNHHQMSHKWVRTTDHPFFAWLSDKERWEVAQGCLQHRASFKGEFSCQFAELINAADRELPTTAIDVLQRSIEYTAAKHKVWDYETVRTASIAHVKEKYGHGGYARYPGMYEQTFGVELHKQRNDIANL